MIRPEGADGACPGAVPAFAGEELVWRGDALLLERIGMEMPDHV